MTEQYIHPRYFLVETWADIFRSPGGPRQYAKFVQYVINCFRSTKREGRIEDVQALFQLAIAEEGLFLSTTVAQIQELNMPQSSHHSPNNSPCMILLVHLLKEVLRKNATKSPVVKKKKKEMYENGLSEDDRAKIKEFMFTSKDIELNPSQERFLQSTINLGFPKAELVESARHARQTNTEMPRDADSLPINLGMCPDSQQPKPLPPRHSKKMMALLRATCPVERSLHERLSAPPPKWPFYEFPTTSKKKANVHADLVVSHGLPNQVDTVVPSGSMQSGCSFYKGPSSSEERVYTHDPDSLPTGHNQTTGGGFFTHELNSTPKPVLYEDDQNEPGQPFHMDANLTTSRLSRPTTLGISLVVRDQDVENHDDYSPDDNDVPAEFLILHEANSN